MKNVLILNLDTIIQSSAKTSGIPAFQPHAITVISKLVKQFNLCPVLMIGADETSEILTLTKQVFDSEEIEFEVLTGSGALLADTSIDWQHSFEIVTNDVSETSAIKIDFDIAALSSWHTAYEQIKGNSRRVKHQRNTKETQITVELNLDGDGKANISTGLHFFDHMLDQIARHGGIDLTVIAKGDLHIDEHHTIEDTAITLGEAFSKALGDKRGIERYGFCLPMDDALAQVALDFGGRNWLVWNASFKREKVGDVPTEMFIHFFKSFSDGAKCNLNVEANGENEHHKIEAIFKAFAKAIKMAVKRDFEHMQLPSTKGVL